MTRRKKLKINMEKKFKRIELPEHITVYELHVDIPNNELDTEGVSIIFSSKEQAENVLEFIAKNLIESGYQLEINGIMDDIYVEERVLFLSDLMFKKELSQDTPEGFYNYLIRYIRKKENY